jgi:regulator of protease activity HflC (stomatin/prohibitin superfamily)
VWEVIIGLGAVGIAMGVTCLKVVKEYDRLVVFTLGVCISNE